jgi:hypothetical protein
MAVRTYAPVGQTPILTVPLTRDHLSVIGGLTMDGRIFLQMQDHSYKGPDVVPFLQIERLRHRKTILCQCFVHAGFPL